MKYALKVIENELIFQERFIHKLKHELLLAEDREEEKRAVALKQQIENIEIYYTDLKEEFETIKMYAQQQQALEALHNAFK